MQTTQRIDDDRQLLTRAVEEFARRTRFPIAFGGLRDAAGVAQISAIVGNRTPALDGLAVAPDRGLGGRAVTELRPRMTGDYAGARQITHDYDTFILGEGIGTLIAVPVLVHGAPRGILYGGAWGSWNVGGVTAAPAVEVADHLGQQLQRRDELALAAPTPVAAPSTAGEGDLSPAQREELRESYAELRRIAATLDDPVLRDRLRDVENRLAALSGAGAQPAAPAPVAQVRLSPRETDVLACAALGSTNAQIAQLLELREGTVKAYLGSAMSKLDASTRHAAVAAARRLGLLP
ncbi:helix-turn-helix transcriptional regulator [Microbacterium sp. G2-8]|uniref:helix-turn-helix transcriptional regulator n=1 Tax=Microbacterium sp. G2-8 TaxID=2842454 RepID=UPI001C8B02DE|nr:helix-turn-helix transcriptional regulator [Microbacterium sp. G2-8]